MRLIDADALVKALNESGVPYRADVQEVLDAQPTIDAVPVVRCKDCRWWDKEREQCGITPSASPYGHWIKISPAGIYECSECGKNVMTSDIEAYEYCHGCGARMDGESDE